MADMVHPRVAEAAAGKPASDQQVESTPLKPSEVLERAADLIEPKGAWTRGQFSDGEGPLDPAATCWCLRGAIHRAHPPSWDEWGATYTTVADYVARVVGATSLYGGLSSWNDHKNRRQKQVVTALRKAAELARSEGQ